MTMSGEELCAKLFEEHYAELVRYAARQRVSRAVRRMRKLLGRAEEGKPEGAK